MGLFPVFRFAIPTTTTTTHLTHHTHSFFFSSPIPLAGCCFLKFWVVFLFQDSLLLGWTKEEKKKHKKIHLHSWALEWITIKRETPPNTFLPLWKNSVQLNVLCFLSAELYNWVTNKNVPKVYHPSSDSVSFGLLN